MFISGDQKTKKKQKSQKTKTSTLLKSVCISSSMDLASTKLYIHASEALSPIKSPPSSLFGSNSHSSHASFPIIAVAIIGILATAFLLVSYYIFVIKCCLNWHRVDILRRFSFSRRRRAEETLVIFHSPVVASESRGLNEAAIRSIPIFKFKKKNESFDAKSCECAVCLNEFQEEEKLRVIPNCAHVFHIDCIDVWLQNNANCPLCRTSISSNTLGAQYSLDQITIPAQTQSPRDPTDNFAGRDEDYVVIEIGPPENSNSGELLTINLPPPRRMEQIRVSQKGAKKFSHVSSMGDECIDNRQKDERFLVQPTRRSFSMDSGADSQLNLAIQEIIQRHREVNVNDDVIISPNEGCSRVNKRSFFSFGQGKSSSRSAVQPVELD